MPRLALLIDPEKDYRPLLTQLKQGAQPDLIFVGGSTNNPLALDDCIEELRRVSDKPICLFPGTTTQLTPKADAILFLSVLSSNNYQLVAGEQIAAAQSVRKTGLKVIPMAYILVDGGRETAVLKLTHTQPVPQSDIQYLTTLAMAAEMMGKQCLYLEAGSGAAMPVQEEVIRAVRAATHITIIVGGGIRTVAAMKKAFKAGADIVVIGNHFEQHPEQLPLFTSALTHKGDEESTDRFYMTLALQEAQKALQHNEIPVGCVIVCGKQIVGRGHNLTETLADVTAHAEIQALTAATQTLGGKYLNDCTLYVTLEPCVMCAAALNWAQLGKLVYGADDPKKGFTTVQPNILHPKTKVVKHVLADQSASLLRTFFRAKR